MSGWAWIWFLLAAAVGAPARFVLDRAVRQRVHGDRPWGTLAVNVTGCLAAGFVVGMERYGDLATTTKVVLASGGLGAFTTFSTLTFDTVRLAEDGDLAGAVGNVAASMLVGSFAALAGLGLASSI